MHLLSTEMRYSSFEDCLMPAMKKLKREAKQPSQECLKNKYGLIQWDLDQISFFPFKKWFLFLYLPIACFLQLCVYSHQDDAAVMSGSGQLHNQSDWMQTVWLWQLTSNNKVSIKSQENNPTLITNGIKESMAQLCNSVSPSQEEKKKNQAFHKNKNSLLIKF